MPLFEEKDFITHSGLRTFWKIECDSLTEEDWATLAKIVASTIKFRRAIGVPSVNGEKFAEQLNILSNPYSSTILLVDDVLTTGKSLEELWDEQLDEGSSPDFIKGAVVFARGECPGWITPIFQLNKEFM